jgi:hypothetical protein
VIRIQTRTPLTKKQIDDSRDDDNNGDDSAEKPKVLSHKGVAEVETGLPFSDGGDNGSVGNVGASGSLAESDGGCGMKDRSKERERERDREDGGD